LGKEFWIFKKIYSTFRFSKENKFPQNSFRYKGLSSLRQIGIKIALYIKGFFIQRELGFERI
jgi:hypothetical protein